MKRWLILAASAAVLLTMAYAVADEAPKDRYDDKPEPIAFTSPDGVSGVVMPDGRTVLTGEPTPAKNPACECPDCACGKLKGKAAKLDAAVEGNAFVQGLSVHIDELRARLDKVEAENAKLREHHAQHQKEQQAKLTKPPAVKVLHSGTSTSPRTYQPRYFLRN